MSAPCFIEVTRRGDGMAVMLNVADISSFEREIETGCTVIYMRSSSHEYRALESYENVIAKIADAAKFDPSSERLIDALTSIEMTMRHAQL